ncbi:hypothetical protein [Paraburkholderia phenazinium]|uniref:Uncharacterized protein n=1 Tax=Paraburkholderia phenazinium TaxID=60549 RepID=A0A1N6KZ56_9BURK|nr:hypothetical protein [Paraburkholderia phenazinium]SIO61657.1 hypothetical protein SAMN05444165_5300 [Paraburkholderia phenazinium]
MKYKGGFSGKRHAIVIALSAVLAAGCGGGGSSSSPNPLFNGSGGSNISAVQQAYESIALASNGGLHYLSGQLSFSTSSTGVLSLSPSSYFYSDNSSIPASPANGAQTVTLTQTSVASTLSVPSFTPVRYLVNGSVFVRPVPDQAKVSYSGSNVQENYLATDGQTVVETLLGTSYTTVSLSGLLSGAPSELVSDSDFGLLTDSINGQSLYNLQASWQAGSAYVKVVRQVVGNTLGVGDCVAPATTGTNITPCSTTVSTLENFFPYTSTTDGTIYQLAAGQITTVAGVRAWVANTALSTATPEYRVFYQSNGGIYTGALIKDGTPLQVAPSGGGTPTNFYIFLNSAALQSVKSALNF